MTKKTTHQHLAQHAHLLPRLRPRLRPITMMMKMKESHSQILHLSQPQLRPRNRPRNLIQRLSPSPSPSPSPSLSLNQNQNQNQLPRQRLRRNQNQSQSQSPSPNLNRSLYLHQPMTTKRLRKHRNPIRKQSQNLAQILTSGAQKHRLLMKTQIQTQKQNRRRRRHLKTIFKPKVPPAIASARAALPLAWLLAS